MAETLESGDLVICAECNHNLTIEDLDGHPCQERQDAAERLRWLEIAEMLIYAPKGVRAASDDHWVVVPGQFGALIRGFILTKERRDMALNAETVQTPSNSTHDMASNAEMPKPKKRAGGKRKWAKQQGLCYLKNVPKVLRPEAKQLLGYRPLIGEVDIYFSAQGIIPRGTKILFVGSGCHVLRKKGWPSALQWRILNSDQGRYRKVGADDWDDVFEEGFAELFTPLNHFEVEPAEAGAEEPVYVRGSGSCWKNLGVSYFAPGLIDDDDTNVTVDTIIDFIHGLPENAKAMVVSWEVQADGDIHVKNIGRNRYKNGAFANAKEGIDTFSDWVVTLEGYRTKLVGAPAVPALDDAMRQFSSPEMRGGVERLVQPLIRDGVENMSKLFPYHVKVELQHFMEPLSLPWSKFNVIPHPHAIHAGIRRWIYMVELPKYIKCDTTFVGMKLEHFEMVSREVTRLYGEGTYVLKHVNTIVDHKDIGRYAGTGTVADTVWDLPEIDTPGVHFDESGHYLSPEFMLHIKNRNPGLRVMTTSNIFPLLALEFETSPYPELVDWRVKQTKTGPMLLYIAEGDEGGMYIQPFDPTMTLLRSVTQKDGSAVWKGGVVAKKLHHRLQVFYAYEVDSPAFLAEKEAVMMPLPKLFRGQPKTAPVPVEYYVKMLQYAKVLVGTDEKNQWAKLRQFHADSNRYFPIGDQAWLIKVVMHAANVTVTADLQPKNYSSAREELYYKTVGHLVRKYQSVFALRYANRNRALINHRDPLYIWPTIDVVVEGSDAFHGYGISWDIGADPGADFWHRMKTFVSAWATKLGCRNVSNDVDLAWGKVRFPFLANTTWNRTVWGVDMIKHGQARDFLKIFEKKEFVRPFVPIRRQILAPVRNFEPPPLPPRPPHLIPLPPDEPGDFDYPNMATGSDSDSYYSLEYMDDPDETVSSTEVGTEESFKGKEVDLDLVEEKRHCDDCLEVSDFKQMGGWQGYQSYVNFCEARHALEQTSEANTDLRRSLLGVLARGVLRRGSPEGDAKGTRTLEQPDLEKLKREAKLNMEVHTAVEPHYITIPDKEVSHIPKSHAERQLAWENKYGRRPKEAKINFYLGQAIRSTLWNQKYPQTIDKRFSANPYSDIVEYPTVSYPTDDCLLVALATASGKSVEDVFCTMLAFYPVSEIHSTGYLSHKCIWPFALHFGLKVIVVDERGMILDHYGVSDSRFELKLSWNGTHIKSVSKTPGLVIRKPAVPRILGTPDQMNLIRSLNKWPALTWHEWEPEGSRGAEYVRALLARTTGLLGIPLNEASLQEWLASCDVPVRTKKYMAVIPGQPGCRKSSRLKRELTPYRRVGDFVVIEPTSVLAQSWKDGLDALGVVNGSKLPGTSVLTFEKAIATAAAANLVVTDENRFPKGYMALFHILNPSCRYHIFLGDPWQSSWHEPNSDCLLNRTDLLGELEFYMKYADRYLIGTWRPTACADFFRMPNFNGKSTSVHFSQVMPQEPKDLEKYFPRLDKQTILSLWKHRGEFYASHVATSWAEQLRGGENNTFAGSVGLEYPFSIIEVDEKVMQMGDPRLIYTAMTRAQHILFVYKWVPNGRTEAICDAHPIFRELEWYRYRYKEGVPVRWNKEHTVSIYDITFPIPASMKQVLSGPPSKLRNWAFVKDFWPEELLQNFIDPDDHKRSGARISEHEEAYIDQPQFRNFIEPMEEYDEPETTAPEYQAPEYRMKTHVPEASRGEFEEFHNSAVKERYANELFMKEYSVQLPDTPQRRRDAVEQMRALVDKAEGRNKRERQRNVLRKLSGVPDSENPLLFNPIMMNWGLEQRSNDNATFLAAIKQRINYSTVADNERMMEDQRPFGNLCWEAFRHYLGWHSPVPFDELLYHKSIIAFQVRRGERSQALKKQSLNRADPDFNLVLTMKGQWKLKDRIAGAAKPGQPVVIHSDAYTFKHGPFGIYLLEMIMRNKPDYWHLHARKTPEELEAWVARHFAEDEMYHMNDQKAQDQAVQGWAVVFFSHLMRWFGIPEDFVTEFIADKMNKQLGRKIMALMTDSGEIWTYLINSGSSAARECARYGLPPGLPMANGGDDIKRRRYGQLTLEYLQVQNQDPSIDKRYESMRGDFVSFIVKRRTLFKDPIILLKRFLARLSRGEATQIIDGYFHLWAFNYAKGEKLQYLDEDELEAHQIMTRIMFNLRKEGVKAHLDWSILRIDGEIHDDRPYDLFLDSDLASNYLDTPSSTSAGEVLYESAVSAAATALQAMYAN